MSGRAPGNDGRTPSAEQDEQLQEECANPSYKMLRELTVT